MATEDQGLHRGSESPPILTGQITGRQGKALTGEEGKESDGRERTGEQKRENENCASGVPLTYLLVINAAETKRLLSKRKRT